MKRLIFWLVPIIVVLLQLNFTIHSIDQIRYQEVADGPRNAFWFANGKVYNGLDSFISWYAFCALIYHFFGFNIFTIKFVKILIELVSLICLAQILKKYLNYSSAALAIIVIGLSPTSTYFNMLQSTYGIDLLLLPVIFYLFLKIDFKKQKTALVLQVLTFMLIMLTWIAYPTFIFFLPVLGIFYIYLLKRQKKDRSFLIKNILISITAFLIPLILGFIYIQNREILIYDPFTRSGLFRGGGKINLSLQLFVDNSKYLLENLFLNGNGFYYEVLTVDFSWTFPILSLLLVFFVTFKILFSKKLKKNIQILRFPLLLMFFVLVFNILIVNFSDVLTPGLRRYTPMLGTIYGLFIISWYYLSTKVWKNILYKRLVLLILLLIPLHHILAYPSNLEYLKSKSPYAYYKDAIFFNEPGPPEKAISNMITKVQKEDLNLVCLDEQKNPNLCRYSEIYAVVAGSCLWNKLNCHDIYGYSLKSQKFVKLSLDLLE